MVKYAIKTQEGKFLEGKGFCISGGDTHATLIDMQKDMQNKGYQAVFMPPIIDAMVETEDEEIFRNSHTSISLRATGITEKGTRVILYAHIPHYFINPENILKAKIKGIMEDIMYYNLFTGEMPREEFLKLLKLEDNKDVFVVGEDVTLKWPRHAYGIDKPTPDHIKEYGGKIDGKDMIAINHPEIVPSFGGGGRAEKYLQRYKEVTKNGIIVINHPEDFFNEQPLGRLLHLGQGFDYCYIGSGLFDPHGYVVGIPKSGVLNLTSLRLEERL